MAASLGRTFKNFEAHARRLWGEARRYFQENHGGERGAVERGPKEEPFKLPDDPTLEPEIPPARRLAVAEAVNRRGGRVAPPESGPVDSAAEKLIGLVGKAKPVLKETESLRAGERLKRAEELRRIQGGMGGERALIESKRALKGELPRADFEPVRPKLEPAEVEGRFNKVWSHEDLRPYERMPAADALYNILDPEGGRLPQQNELLLLEKVFGRKHSEAVLSRRGTWEKSRDFLVDASTCPEPSCPAST